MSAQYCINRNIKDIVCNLYFYGDFRFSTCFCRCCGCFWVFFDSRFIFILRKSSIRFREHAHFIILRCNQMLFRSLCILKVFSPTITHIRRKHFYAALKYRTTFDKRFDATPRKFLVTSLIYRCISLVMIMYVLCSIDPGNGQLCTSTPMTVLRQIHN